MGAGTSSTDGSSSTTRHFSTRYVVKREPRRWLALFAIVPLLAGLIETNSRIEDDLEGKAVALGANSADFSAQDGSICADDYAAVAAALRNARGVGSVGRADDCPSAADTSTAASAESASETPEPAATTEPAPAPNTAAAATTAPPIALDLVDTLAAYGSFGTLVELVGAAGLTDALRGAGPLTVFAPTDEAFAQLDPSLVEQLTSDPELLASVLTYHAVPGALPAADLTSGPVDALSGETLDITVAGTVTIDADGSSEATVVRPDIPAANGIIHAIDGVLIPPSLRTGTAGASALDVTATYDGARLVLTGTVDTDEQRQIVVDGALAAMGGDATRVDDQLAVAGTPLGDDVAAADDRAAQLGFLLGGLPVNFASGEVKASDTVSISGLALDDAALAAEAAVAGAAGVAPDDVQIDVRPEATAADRDQLIADINALFVDQTIEFAPSSANILDESAELLDTVAARLRQFDLTGIVITIEGHTDADGSADSNQALSQSRAEAVEQALVARGIADDALDPVGFGEDRPIAPNDTAENKARNRRVTLSAQQ